MPTFDLTDPALREQWGLQEENPQTVFRPSKWRRELRQERRDRGVSQQVILEVVRASDEPLSRRQIREQIGRLDSPYFRGVLAEMVALGLLVEYELPYARLPMFVYEAADAAQ